MLPTKSEQVFVTDITYIKLEGRHAYLALVTDLYSKKVMGYKLDDNMRPWQGNDYTPQRQGHTILLPGLLGIRRWQRYGTEYTGEV